MKREADGDMGSPHKRSRRGDEEVRLLIPSKVAGSIIGKGGQNITKLRSQYKASITVPDCPGPERMLTLSSDLDSICNIVSDVVPNLEENAVRLSNGSMPNELDLRMMIHQSQAGCVIGRAGCKIKEIREKTGARIKIFSNLAPQSTDRIIQIIGEPNKCVDTIREVLTLIKQSPIKGAVNPYDPHNYDDYYAEEYGGWGTNSSGGSSSGGNTGRRSEGGPRNSTPQRNSRFREQSSGSGGRSSNRSQGGGGSGQSRENGGLGFNLDAGSNFSIRPLSIGDSSLLGNRNSSFGGSNPRLMNGGNSSPFERNGWSGGSSSGSGQFSGPPPNIMSSSLSQSLQSSPVAIGGQGGNGGSGGKTTTQVTIPKELAGAIIGKGGGRIRKIRLDSGASITIDEPLPGSSDRIITIAGMPNQIQMAQYLLQQSVHNNSEQRNNY